MLKDTSSATDADSRSHTKHRSGRKEGRSDTKVPSELASKIVLKRLRDRGIRRRTCGLSVAEKGQEHIVVGRFKVLGAAITPEGVADGAVIAATGVDGKLRKRHVPMDALQESKKLGAHLAAIGLDPPLETSRLRAIATYIHEISRLGRCLILGREGIHQIEYEGRTVFIAALGGTVIAPSGVLLDAVSPSTTTYQVAGTLDSWKGGLEPIFAGNPLVIFGPLVALAAVLPAFFELPAPSVLYTGPSSIGKSSVAQLVQSANRSPSRLQRWSGTENGVEALAALHCDTALVLDELGTAPTGSLSSSIYRLSAGEGKARATGSGELRTQAVMRCSVFATGEVTKAELARKGGQVLRDGHEARMPTIRVRERYGVFSTLPPGCDGGAELSRRLHEVVVSNYGLAGPAFVRALIENQDRIKARLPKKAVEYRKLIVAAANSGELTAVEGRVLEGFLTLAIAGRIAVHFGVLPMTGEEVIQAVSYVFGLWLAEWRIGSDSGHNRAVAQVRTWFQRRAQSAFVPIANWRDPSARVRAGYVYVHPKEELLYLVHLDAMCDEICDGIDLNEVLDALQAAGLLATPGKGRQWLKRMPGVPKDADGSRMKFYAIRGAILFDR